MRHFTATITLSNDSETLAEGLKLAKETLQTLGLKGEVRPLKSIRSLNQNSALHLWMEMLEEECEAQGVTMDMIITKPQEIPITRHLLKDLFRLIGLKMFRRKSTADLEKDEFGTVQKVFEKTIGERLQIYIPFPSLDQQIDKDYD